MSDVGIGRRGFLGAVAGIAGALALGGPERLGAQMKQRLGSTNLGAPIPDIGVQLYTVRSRMAEDADATLRAVAAMGYDEVEFAGLWGRTAQEMRMRLDDLGLRAASSHNGLPDMTADKIEQLVADAHTLGQSYIVCPWTDGGDRTPDGYRRVAAGLNAAAQVASGAGIGIGYHNHSFEFDELEDGSNGLAILLAETDAERVSFQLDLFWAVNAGVDPIEMMRAHPGRFTTVHVKDRTPAGDMVAVGDGVIDFQSILTAATPLGLKHAFVEHDNPEDPMDSIRKSYEHLSGLMGTAHE